MHRDGHQNAAFLFALHGLTRAFTEISDWQYADRETGLVYNANRDYDSGIGRYVQSDPIGIRAGLNTYAYVADNPLRWVDPSGLVISGRWIKTPYAHDLNVDYVGWHFDVGAWKWLPPSIRIAMIDFYGSAIISFEIECTDDDKCRKRTWTISPNIPVGTDIHVPLRLTIVSHPLITAAKIALAARDAYKFLQHWAAVQTAIY